MLTQEKSQNFKIHPSQHWKMSESHVFFSFSSVCLYKEGRRMKEEGRKVGESDGDRNSLPIQRHWQKKFGQNVYGI